MVQVCHLIGGVIKGWQSVANPLASDSCMSDDLQLPIWHFWPFNVVKCCQMLSKKQPWQWPLTFEKNPWHLTKKSIAKENAFEAVGFQPLADSGALVQSRFQIKNQRENIWRTTFPDNHSIPKDFELAWHRVQVPRCQAMVVFFYVFAERNGKVHFTTPVDTRRKPERVHNLLGTKLQKTHIKTWSPRSWCKETPELQPSQRGDEWRRSLSNAQARAHTRSHCEGADFRSRRRHRCLRFCILQIIGQRSQLDSMRSQFLLNVLDMANAPRQVARAKENMENIMMELHIGAWHTELQRECTQGSLVPLGQSAKDFNKLQWYLPGNRMVNGAKLLFHPNIKLRHVVFSDQGGSWHCLKYICRAASVCSCLGCRDLSNKKGQITNTAWKNSSGTMLLQLQQLHSCNWKDNWLPKYARLSLDGGWRRA